MYFISYTKPDKHIEYYKQKSSFLFFFKACRKTCLQNNKLDVCGCADPKLPRMESSRVCSAQGRIMHEYYGIQCCSKLTYISSHMETEITLCLVYFPDSACSDGIDRLFYNGSIACDCPSLCKLVSHSTLIPYVKRLD